MLAGAGRGRRVPAGPAAPLPCTCLWRPSCAGGRSPWPWPPHLPRVGDRVIAELIDHVRSGLRAEGWSGRCRSGGGARGSAKHSSASGRSQIRSYSYGSGARRFELGALPSSRPRLVVAMVFSDASPTVLESAVRPQGGWALPADNTDGLQHES
eukprot:scaffold43644_cov39-Phaeocystis_antarctica.AAC.1